LQEQGQNQKRRNLYLREQSQSLKDILDVVKNLVNNIAEIGELLSKPKKEEKEVRRSLNANANADEDEDEEEEEEREFDPDIDDEPEKPNEEDEEENVEDNKVPNFDEE